MTDEDNVLYRIRKALREFQREIDALPEDSAHHNTFTVHVRINGEEAKRLLK